MKKKGMSFSDFVFFMAGAALIFIGLMLLLFLSQKSQDQNYQEVLSSKDGYQSIQLARTFTQTPLLYNGESQTIAHWVNYYFTKATSSEKTDLAILLSKAGSDIILPQLREDSDSVAVFNYYIGEKKEGYLTVARVRNEDLDERRIESVNYVSSVQEDVTIQLPVYIEDDKFDPKKHKIELYMGIETKTDSDVGRNFLW